MLEFENVFKRKELQDIYIAGEVKPLEDLYLLEDVAMTVKDLDKQKDFYKDYKKKKSRDIDDAIKVLDNKMQFYKSIMISTLDSQKEKSVKFPGSCVVSSRNQASKWVVKDEEEFIAVLKAAKKAGEDVDDVLEEVVQFNVRKREANKLLKIWEDSGKLQGFLDKAKKGSQDIVVKEPEKKIVSIRFIEEVKEEDIDDSVKNISVPKKDDEETITSIDDYDSL